MQVDFDVVGLVVAVAGGGIAIGRTVASGFRSVEGKIDGLSDTIQKMQLDNKDNVTHTTCSDRRDKCPCIKAVDDLTDRVHALEVHP